MKIYTITCHDVYNAGASLQAYALMLYLKELGHNVEIINYKPDYLSGHYRLWGGINPKYENSTVMKLAYNCAKFPSRLKEKYGKKKRLFDKFTYKYLTVTVNKYCNNLELKNKLPAADLYIAGSDQIWNPIFKNGHDPAFYLDFVPKNMIKASYAASFAVDNIPVKACKDISRYLKEFNFISVRESSALKILKSMDITNGEHVLDPVFLLNRDKWNRIAKQISTNKEYLVVYDFDNSNVIKKIAMSVAKEQKLRIYSLSKCEYADYSYNNMGPVEFLGLILEAKFIISNSFHATAFSIIYHKQFLVVGREEKINSRMYDLLHLLQIEDRYVNLSVEISKLKKINYTEVQKLLDINIGRSKNYLAHVLQGVKDA